MKRLGATARWLVLRSRLSQAAQRSQAIYDLARNYFVGETAGEAAKQARVLRKQGLQVSFGYLGDGDWRATDESLLAVLDELGEQAKGAEVSVKLAPLTSAEAVAEQTERLHQLTEAATRSGALVTLEMHRADDYRETIKLYSAVAEHYADLGITIPTNVRRAAKDCRKLARLGRRIRLCIGAYPASAHHAISNEHEKSLALVRCIRIVMESEAYPMVASHDPRIIEITQELARRNNRDADSFEFQMYYGVRPLEQRRLVDIGLTCRSYMPFGPDWYEFFARRVAERPRMLANYLRALLDKR